MAKNLAGDVLDTSKDRNRYVSEYSSYSIPALKKEYSKLKKCGTSKDNTNRKVAIASILQKHNKQKAANVKKK